MSFCKYQEIADTVQMMVCSSYEKQQKNPQKRGQNIVFDYRYYLLN